MRYPPIQRRVVGAILIATGSLPFIAAAILVASAFVLPALFRWVFALFVPPGPDAPDNWAIAITRMTRLFILSGGTGALLTCTGLWLSRGATE